MGGFLQTLLHPDQDEDPERGEIVRAANLLQIGEFQLLQLAYKAWHGRELDDRLSDHVFRAYMVRSQVPIWARHYARRILDLAERGELDDHDPEYHRYDSDYYKALPLGARRLLIALFCIGFVIYGGLLVGYLSPPSVSQVLPPYFDDKELVPAPPSRARDS